MFMYIHMFMIDYALKMVGIWLLNEWLQAKQPENVRLVELGPGRGTLMADILRVSIVFLLYCIVLYYILQPCGEFHSSSGILVQN